MDRLYPLSVMVPFNTPINATLLTNFPLEDAQLDYIEIEVPDGCVGLVGFRVLRAGQQIIPWSNNYFLTLNNRLLKVNINDQITSTGLVIEAYNLDVFSHTLYFRAMISDLPLPGSNEVAPTSASLALPNGAAAQGLGMANTLVAGGPPDVISGGLTDSELAAQVDANTLSVDESEIPLPTDVPLTDITGNIPSGVTVPPTVIPPVEKSPLPKPPITVPPIKVLPKRVPPIIIRGKIQPPIIVPPHKLEQAKRKHALIGAPNNPIPRRHKRRI